MTDIRKLPAVDERVETGAVQFGDDWPGTFIRGDNAAFYALNLDRLIQQVEGSSLLDFIMLSSLRGLLSDLQASNLNLRTSLETSEGRSDG